MISTNYGSKKAGSSPFVIVAPHAAGDDLKTGYIARQLAESLNGFALINTVYKKPSNTKARPENTEDFNQLSWWAAKQKYLWFRPKRRHKDMRHFFRDLKEYCDEARKFRPDKKAVCIHIHGMKPCEYGIDLGVGIPDETKKTEKNTGINTLEMTLVKNLQAELEKILFENYQLKVSIGKYSGISRQSAIQFHVHDQYNDHAVQIEISSFFRMEKEKIDFIIQTLSKTLSKIF